MTVATGNETSCAWAPALHRWSVLTDGQIFNRSLSVFPEFDRRRPRLYPLAVAHRTRKSVLLSPEVVEAAQQRGLSLGDYVQQLHQNQRSSRIAYAASIYRGFALLEMARVPIDPAYFELVDGCMDAEESLAFRVLAASGEDHALVRAAAQLLGPDTRRSAVQAILLASQRAQVLHEGFIESARLLEATFYR
jgi:hypothetical protein